MSQIILVFPLLVVLSTQGSPPPPPAVLGRFEAAKKEAGKEPAKLIALALWCEAHGLYTQQRDVLEEAVRLDPENAKARGLLGQVSYQHGWETPEAVSRKVKEDEALMAKLAEYNAYRDRIDRDTEIERRGIAALEKAGRFVRASELKMVLDRKLAPEHERLGLWCEQNGLKPEALAHFTTALHLNPHHEATWRHLGYVKHRGRWMSHEQIAAEEHEALAQKHADHRWEPLLRRWAADLAIRSRHAQAMTNLAKVADPRAVPSIVRLFGRSSPAVQTLAVRLLGQIDAPRSSMELAALAVYSEDPEVREAAARALKGREPRDWAGGLVDLIHAPMTYAVRPVAGPGSQGALVIDSPRFRITRTYNAPPAFELASNFHGYAGYDVNGLPVVMSGFEWRHFQNDLNGGHDPLRRLSDAAQTLRQGEARAAELLAQAQVNALIARERLAADVRDVEEANARAKVLNPRIEAALRSALDAPQGLGEDDEDAWHSWYFERIGYRYTPPPKVMAAVNALPEMTPPRIVSCFAAGTPVRTIEGPRPIESIRTGDQVLSRDVTTGVLAFHSVLTVHHNPPDNTLRVALENGDAVVASRFHRFWLLGRGWAMAKQLKPGDIVRTLGGPARIIAVEQAPVQPVFNLDVDESRTYFVGSSAMLVHDNTLPSPHPVSPPFDHVADPLTINRGEDRWSPLRRDRNPSVYGA